MALSCVGYRFVCPVCCKGRRPRLDAAMSLLASADTLDVSILEVHLLRDLIAGATAWRARAAAVMSQAVTEANRQGIEDLLVTGDLCEINLGAL